MVRFVMLVKFTDKGMAAIDQSVSRKEAFQKSVKQAGGKLESIFWTLGEYDGVAVFSAPDDTTAAALALGVAKLGNVRTTLLRAFDAEEFKKILERLP